MAEVRKAVHHQPLKENIFEFLHERIIAGGYAPGEWLRQEDISSQLGVSMTPVREALDLLVSAGLAERVPYRGVRVLRPTAREIADSYMMRLLLESAAVHAAALHITVAEVQQLEGILERSKALVSLKDMSSERVLNRDLHGLIAAASGNALLHKSYMTVLNTFPDWMLYEYMFRHPELLDQSIHSEYEEHRAIVDALAGHDPDLAVQKTVAHLTNRGRELQAYLGVPGEMISSAEAQVLPLLARFTKV